MGLTHFFLFLFIIWLLGKFFPRPRRSMYEESQEYLSRYHGDKGVRKF